MNNFRLWVVHAKFEAHSPHRLNRPLRASFLKLLAQISHHYIHYIFVYEVVVTPDILNQLPSGERLPRVTHEAIEQIELPNGES